MVARDGNGWEEGGEGRLSDPPSGGGDNRVSAMVKQNMPFCLSDQGHQSSSFVLNSG